MPYRRRRGGRGAIPDGTCDDVLGESRGSVVPGGGRRGSPRPGGGSGGRARLDGGRHGPGGGSGGRPQLGGQRREPVGGVLGGPNQPTGEAAVPDQAAGGGEGPDRAEPLGYGITNPMGRPGGTGRMDGTRARRSAATS
jgi:translation initiation factor IF-2